MNTSDPIEILLGQIQSLDRKIAVFKNKADLVQQKNKDLEIQRKTLITSKQRDQYVQEELTKIKTERKRLRFAENSIRDKIEDLEDEQAELNVRYQTKLNELTQQKQETDNTIAKQQQQIWNETVLEQQETQDDPKKKNKQCNNNNTNNANNTNNPNTTNNANNANTANSYWQDMTHEESNPPISTSMEDCSICYTADNEKPVDWMDERVGLETCGHAFHSECIHEWIVACEDRVHWTKKQKKKIPTCPLCRAAITAADCREIKRVFISVEKKREKIVAKKVKQKEKIAAAALKQERKLQKEKEEERKHQEDLSKVAKHQNRKKKNVRKRERKKIIDMERKEKKKKKELQQLQYMEEKEKKRLRKVGKEAMKKCVQFITKIVGAFIVSAICGFVLYGLSLDTRTPKQIRKADAESATYAYAQGMCKIEKVEISVVLP